MRAAIASLVLGALLAVGVGAVNAEVSQKGNLRVAVSAKIVPQRLPRTKTAPIAVTLSSEIGTTDGKQLLRTSATSRPLPQVPCGPGGAPPCGAPPRRRGSACDPALRRFHALSEAVVGSVKRPSEEPRKGR